MKSFDALGLSKGLVQSVARLGFETPTPIQEKAIPVLLQGDRDFVGLAQTGTGKTAAFGLPLLDLTDDESKITQGLVLAPTRELCLQIVSDLQKFSPVDRNFNVVAIYGGSNISEQIKKLKKGAQIVVATPGRLIDVISRKAIRLEDIQYVVLDEADEMLNMGFKEDLDEILSHTPEDKITWLFSATMPNEVKRIMKNYMSDPFELTVGEKNSSNTNIDHQVVVIQEKERYAALKRILDFNPDIFGLIFCRTRIETQQVADNLMREGYNADALHGDLTQQQRDKVMKRFRQKALHILVATDVAARGIDVDDITHVIHLNIPDEIEFYTHRSGRTARAGKKGVSIALATKRELGRIKQIEKIIKTNFKIAAVPTRAEICSRQLLSLMHRVREVQVNEQEIAEFLPAIFDELQGLEREELIKRFASLEFNRFLEYYRGLEDIKQSSVSEEGGDRYRTGSRIFINLGKMDGLDKASILELIDECCSVSKKSIGKIELKGAYSFFEVEKDKTDDIINGFQNVEYNNRVIRVEITDRKPESSGKDKSGRKKKFHKNSQKDSGHSRNRRKERVR